MERAGKGKRKVTSIKIMTDAQAWKGTILRRVKNMRETHTKTEQLSKEEKQKKVETKKKATLNERKTWTMIKDGRETEKMMEDEKRTERRSGIKAVRKV